MRKYRDFRKDFAAGVVSKEFLARSRDEVTGQALKQGTNAFVTDSGSVMRRCGSNRLFQPQNEGRTFEFEMPDGSIRHLLFYAGGVRIYQANGTLDATLSGPWGANDLFTMAIAPGKDQLVIASRSFHPRRITMVAGSFSIGNFTFQTEPNQRRASPFIGSGILGLSAVTMTPSGYSGTVTVQFSANVLTANHVGVHFMYMGCQLRIASVTNGQQGTATVLDTIYPTLRCGVSNASGFRTGDMVEGDVTNVRGQIVAVGASTVDIVLATGYTQFMAPAGEAQGEKLISPTANEYITSVTTLANPGATNIWFEELISTARGYPATCCFHRERLVFAGFPVAKGMFAASAIGAYDYFDLGSQSDDDAMQEFIGRDPNAIILHAVAADQLLLLTDRGGWYVGEINGLFAPKSIAILPISPDAASVVPPVWTPEGVVFFDTEYRALLISLTGTQRGPYAVTDLSRLGRELIKTPKQLVYASGVGGRQERAIACLNSDGTAAVFVYRRTADQAGWLPWSRGTGTYVSFSAFSDDLYCLAKIGSSVFYEVFDFDAVMDSEFDPGVTAYVSETVDLLKNSHVVGAAALNGSGVLADIGTLAPVDRLGHDFPVVIEPTPMVIAEAGRQRRRNTRTWIDVIDSGLFYLNGKQCAAYPYDADLETQPEVGDREYQASQLGSSVGRTVLIEQRMGEGAPLHVRSLTIEVSAR